MRLSYSNFVHRNSLHVIFEGKLPNFCGLTGTLAIAFRINAALTRHFILSLSSYVVSASYLPSYFPYNSMTINKTRINKDLLCIYEFTKCDRSSTS